MAQELITKDNIIKPMKHMIAEWIAEDTLDKVNENSFPVEYHETFYTKHGKRWLDFLIALVAFIVSLPVNLVIAIITIVDVGFPMFFFQNRVGKDEKIFQVVKFRNMTNKKGPDGELLPPHMRVTKSGKIIRKLSLDELLNFWSVLKGDMSLIGPRPLVPEMLGRFNNRHRSRFKVRPGLECPPRDLSSSVRTWQDQFENDVWYVENVSFKTDVMMLWNLVRFTFDRKNAAARGGATRGDFMGYKEDGTAMHIQDVPQEYFDRLNRQLQEQSKAGDVVV